MMGMRTAVAMLIALCMAAPVVSAQMATAPQSWIDATTGHRIVRISTQPGSLSLYFHQNSYTPQGDAMVMTTPDGIARVRLSDWRVTPLVRRADAKLLFAGRRTRTAYYSVPWGKGSAIHAVDIDTGRTRRIARIDSGAIGAINSDETLLLGQWAQSAPPLQPGGEGARPGETAFAATGADGQPLSYADAKEVRLNQRLEARIPMEIFTIDIRTGARRVVVASTDWLNHVQFSPTDPTRILYCHEGPWHRVDRIWTIRTDGSDKRLVHQRTMAMEIAGHEFFSADGKWVWYDLQTPRGEIFWLAGLELATGKRRQMAVPRDQWSVHYSPSPDGAHFSGDGGDAEMVARARDGKYLYRFTPRPIPDVAGIRADNADALIQPSRLEVEKIVDLRGHDYRLEPNATFTPDGRWLLFRSNMEGATHVYAAEVKRTDD
nr:oligogalacturonate lyase family protein [Sphingobium sp. KCTC 72723]